jgi:succinoglycan biosynthesis transport protein ExoP
MDDALEHPDSELILRGKPIDPATFLTRVMEPEPPRPIIVEPAAGLNGYGQLITRRKWQLLGITAACAIAGLLAALAQAPMYQAHTSLEIQGPNDSFLNLKDLDPAASSGASFAETYVETQARILQDEGLIEKVVDRIGADQHPQSVIAPGILTALRRFAGKFDDPQKQTAHEAVVAAAVRNLRVHASNLSHVVEVTFDSPDPQFAADFANALSNELIEQNLDVRWKAALRIADWLSNQMQDLKNRYEKSANQLQAYARSTGLVLNSDKGDTAAEEKLRLVQEELSRAQADLAAKQSRYELSRSSSPESVPEVLDNGPLREYQLKLTELKRQLAELEAGFTPGYFKVKNMRAQVNEIESVIRKERGNVVDRLRNEYETAQRREKLVEENYTRQARTVGDQASRSVHYEVLKREVETNRLLYEAMLQKVKEAGVAAAIRASNIRVISPAKRPLRPYQPKPVLNAGMGLLAGLFLGFVFIFVREHTDRSLRAPGDVATYLNLPELGAIPVAKLESAPAIAPSAGAIDLPLAAQDFIRLARLVLHRKPQDGRPQLIGDRDASPVAESFRSALASLWFAGKNGRRPRLFVMASPGPREGKTTVLSNLGIALANTNRRVLLVDGDLRKPRLHKMFNLENTWGLGNILEDDSPIEDYLFQDLVSKTHVPGLYVLTTGTGTGDIASLRYHERLADLFMRFRVEFHAVLLDTPPMLEFSDARILGRLSDGVILVVRAAATTRDDAVAVQRRFQEDGTPILGSILNHWDPKKSHYGYGYRTSGTYEG